MIAAMPTWNGHRRDGDDCADGCGSPRPNDRLGRLGRWCATHPWPLIATWIAVLVLVTVGHGVLGGTYSDNFTLPSSPSQQGAALLRHHDPGQGGQGGQLVFTVASGKLSSDRTAITVAIARVRKVPHVLSVSDPFTAETVSANGRTAVATAHFDTNPQQLGHDYVTRIDTAVTPARTAGVTVNYGGALGKAAGAKSRDRRSTVIGIVVALLVLLVGFGSVYAAGLPLVSAGLATVSGLGALGMIAAASTFPTVSPTFAVMMGLGVGIDYALFLTTRYRQRLIDGVSPGDAAAQALATSGRAILVAATTVTVALLSLYVSGIGFMGKLGVAGAVAVAVGALAALTLVPALLGLLGTSIDRHGVRTPVAESTAESVGWGRYARRVGAHPWRFLLAGVALLCVLAIPLHSLRLGHVGAGADPGSDTAKRAYDEITAAFGPGANGPFTIAVALAPGTSGARAQTLSTSLEHALASTADVAQVGPVHPSTGGNVLVTTVIPKSSPQQQATDTLQTTLRDRTLPSVLAGTDAKGYVTGTTSEQIDFRNQIASRLPLIVAVVVAIAFLLLLLSFGSPVLALKAAVLNLLSTGAAYGIIVAVFQWGWGDSLLGVSGKIPIESYVPMMMFAIVFGLSMDYEVFLLSRVREVWQRTGDNHESVAAGLAATGRVITCAALIMTSVFLAFLLSTNVVVKMLALGLGASILIDATVVRLVVVPAAMFLLGKYNWWTPRWPQRLRSRLRIRARRRPRVRVQRRLAGWVAGALGAAVLMAFAITILTTGGASSQARTAGKGSAGITTTVAAQKVTDARLSNALTLAGTVGDDAGAPSITPTTAGTVASLSIAAGQQVSAGQAVATITIAASTGAGRSSAPEEETVTAPVTGTIAQILVPVGGDAGPTSPIATLVGATETLTAQASPMAVNTLDGHVGAKGTATLAIPGETSHIAATLSAIAPTADATTQQTAVEFTTSSALEAGAPVNVTVNLPQPRGPVVPASAIVEVAGQQGVYVVTGSVDATALGIKLPAGTPAGVAVGKATFTPVQVGISQRGRTQVLSGLHAGQTIATTGQTDLISGSKSQRVAILPNGGARSATSSSSKRTASGSQSSSAVTEIDVTVVSLSGRALTVSTPIGQKRLTVPGDFKLTQSDKPVPLSRLRAGDVLKVTFSRASGKLVPISAALQ